VGKRRGLPPKSNIAWSSGGAGKKNKKEKNPTKTNQPKPKTSQKVVKGVQSAVDFRVSFTAAFHAQGDRVKSAMGSVKEGSDHGFVGR